MFIIEGSDGTGKTIATKRVVGKITDRTRKDHKFPVEYAHMGRPKAGFNFHSHYQRYIQRNIVQDRFHLGGIVYHDAINSEALFDIDKWISDKGGCVFILYYESDELYRERIAELSSQRWELLDVDSMVKANREFRLLANRQHKLKPNISGCFAVDSKFIPNHMLDLWISRWEATQNNLERIQDDAYSG